MLKSKEEVLQQLMKNGPDMPLDDFKALYKIMMYQDRGTSSGIFDALELARDHPAIWDNILENVDRSEKIEVTNEMSR